MEKYDYSTLKKLGKDELIYLISVIERDIRKEYEKYSIPPVEFYHMIKDLFQNNKNLNPIPHEEGISTLIYDGISNISLDPVLLRIVFKNVDVESATTGDLDNEELTWVEELLEKGFWDNVVVENVKQVICINGRGVNTDYRSGAAKVKDEDLRCHMAVSNNKITIRDLTELVYRIKSSKFDFYYELYEGISTHLDDKGTLFIEADFDHGP